MAHSSAIKKREQRLIQTLTTVCEIAKTDYDGFLWLTHTASNDNFPASLNIICVFETEAQKSVVESTEQLKALQKLIRTHLLKMGIVVKDIRRHVRLDSERACEAQHQGDWAKRIKPH